MVRRALSSCAPNNILLGHVTLLKLLPNMEGAIFVISLLENFKVLCEEIQILQLLNFSFYSHSFNYKIFFFSTYRLLSNHIFFVFHNKLSFLQTEHWIVFQSQFSNFLYKKEFIKGFFYSSPNYSTDSWVFVLQALNRHGLKKKFFFLVLYKNSSSSSRKD